MKNADSRKLCEEGKIGSKCVNRQFNIYLILFLLFSSHYLAQVPINGFCKKSTLEVDRNLNGIFNLDFNNDKIDDMLLFDKNSRNISILRGEGKGKYSKPINRKFPYIISSIKFVDSVKGQGKIYLFASRNSRLAGVCSFSKSGTPSVISTKRFDSYPQYISVGDLDNDGKNEAVISGSSFDGIIIADFSRLKIRTEQIIKGKNYGWTEFSDLNYDLFPDIITADIFADKLVFFINRFDGTFRESWSLSINSKINSFKTADVNSDKFSDIIINTRNGFEILYGDSVSSFEKRISIKTGGPPLDFVLGDFNNDRNIDLAYLIGSLGEVKVVFDLNNKRHSPVLYASAESPAVLNAAGRKNQKQLLILSENGKLTSIQRQLYDEDSFDLALPVDPHFTAEFSAGKSRDFSVGFIDAYDQSLNLLLGNKTGIFTHYFKYKLASLHKKFVVDDNNDSVKIFYAFTPSQKLIEVYLINILSGNFVEHKLYSPHPIVNVFLSKNNNLSVQPMFVVTGKNRGIGVMSFRYKDFRYVTAYYDDVKTVFEDAVYCNGDKDYIYFWDAQMGNYIFKRLALGKYNSEALYSFENSGGSFKYSLHSFGGGGDDLVLNFFSNGTKNMGILYFGASNKIAFIDEVDFEADEIYADYYPGPNKKIKYLFLYNKETGSFYKSDLTRLKSNYQLSPVFSREGIENYFFTGNYVNKINLIFVHKFDKSISVRKIE